MDPAFAHFTNSDELSMNLNPAITEVMNKFEKNKTALLKNESDWMKIIGLSNMEEDEGDENQEEKESEGSEPEYLSEIVEDQSVLHSI